MKLNTKLKIKFTLTSILATASIVTAAYFYFALKVMPFIFVGLGGAFLYMAIESFIFLKKGVPETIKNPEK
jgi:hypothetical protein